MNLSRVVEFRKDGVQAYWGSLLMVRYRPAHKRLYNLDATETRNEKSKDVLGSRWLIGEEVVCI
jgi:hypothetical protein